MHLLLVAMHLLLVANLVTTSKALVTTSVAPCLATRSGSVPAVRTAPLRTPPAETRRSTSDCADPARRPRSVQTL